MGKETSKSQVDSKKLNKKQDHKPEIANDLSPSEKPPSYTVTSPEDLTLQRQASRLADTRFQTIQRQRMATQLSNLAGNTYMQKVMVQMKNNTKLKQNPSKSFDFVQRQPDVFLEDTILEEAGSPPGVHNARTAIYYARISQQPWLLRSYSNERLIEEAQMLSSFLLGRCADFGQEAQTAIAQFLIVLEREMDRRLRQAELGSNGLPSLEGISWDPDDPLAGTTEAIDPFSMLDVWTTYVREAPAQSEQPEQRPQQRRRQTRHVQFGDEQIIVRVPPGSEQEQEEEGGERSGPPGRAMGGATNSPQYSWLGQFLGRLDVTFQELGMVAGVLDVVGLAGMEAFGALLATIGAPFAMAAGVISLADAQVFRDKVAYLQGYSLAMIDMTEGNNPNERNEPNPSTWFYRGRAAAIRYINGLRGEGPVLLAALRRNHASPQGRVDLLWQTALQSQSQDLSAYDQALAQGLRPTF